MRTPFPTAVVALIAALLGGCAGMPDASSADTLAKLTRSGTLTLGYREDSVPFSFKGPDGQPAGYSVELCRAVAESLKTQLKLPGLDLKWVPVTVATRVSSLVDGTIDLECGTTSRTLSRMERVDFSVPTFVEGASFVAPAASGLRTGRDLAGRRVAVIPGTTTETMLKASQANAGFTGSLVPVKTHDEGLAAVRDGRAEVYMTDRTILVGQVLTSGGGERWTLSEDFFSIETYALMMRRDASFRVAVDRALSNLYRSGAVLAVFRRAFGSNAVPTPSLEAMYLHNALPE